MAAPAAASAADFPAAGSGPDEPPFNLNPEELQEELSRAFRSAKKQSKVALRKIADGTAGALRCAQSKVAEFERENDLRGKAREAVGAANERFEEVAFEAERHAFRFDAQFGVSSRVEEMKRVVVGAAYDVDCNLRIRQRMRDMIKEIQYQLPKVLREKRRFSKSGAVPSYHRPHTASLLRTPTLTKELEKSVCSFSDSASFSWSASLCLATAAWLLPPYPTPYAHSFPDSPLPLPSPAPPPVCSRPPPRVPPQYLKRWAEFRTTPAGQLVMFVAFAWLLISGWLAQIFLWSLCIVPLLPLLARALAKAAFVEGDCPSCGVRFIGPRRELLICRGCHHVVWTPKGWGSPRKAQSSSAKSTNSGSSSDNKGASGVNSKRSARGAADDNEVDIIDVVAISPAAT
ncbi:unnamed protein product [Closterium sp. Naga37s-1]|nr:unnamed protein product [Closterium sp. Naga37s-1]